MHTRSIGIFGASGYTGMEATRILVGHPGVTLRFVAGERYAQQPVARHIEGAPSGLAYCTFEEGEAQARGCDVVLLATPTEISQKLAPRLLALGCKVIDLSGAFRLVDRELAEKHYGEASELAAVYGLPELNRDAIEDAKLVANPGCYPTAVTLGLLPLVEAGLIELDSVVVTAVSGLSGAGRKATEEYSFVEIDNDVRAYRVLRHQHEPEMRQVLTEQAGAPVPLTFVPHLVPIERGILATATVRAKAPITQSALYECYVSRYGSEPFVSLEESADLVRMKRVVGTNRCVIGANVDGQRIVVVSAIDNLVKGAAGQAVQNLNLLLGYEETMGLGSLRRFFQ